MIKPFARPLRLAALALLSLSLSGCIVLPVGHRHGRHISEGAVVVVPIDRDRGHHPGRGRRH